jgi:hypothetical protein
MKKITLCILFIFSCIAINAQDDILKSIAETQQLSEKVASLFKEHKVSESFTEMTKFWPLPQNEIESLQDQTIKYLNIFNERFGKSIEYVKVKNETIGDFATRETYMIRYTKHAIRLVFTYYKGNEGWIINTFKWDDSFDEEFK